MDFTKAYNLGRANPDLPEEVWWSGDWLADRGVTPETCGGPWSEIHKWFERGQIDAKRPADFKYPFERGE